jgi:hypothetical protein
MCGFVYVILVYWVECGLMDVCMCFCVFLIRNSLLNGGADVAGCIIMYIRPLHTYMTLLASRCCVDGPYILINYYPAGATIHDEPWLLLRLLSTGGEFVTSVSSF